MAVAEALCSVEQVCIESHLVNVRDHEDNRARALTHALPAPQTGKWSRTEAQQSGLLRFSVRARIDAANRACIGRTHSRPLTA